MGKTQVHAYLVQFNSYAEAWINHYKQKNNNSQMERIMFLYAPQKAW